MLRSSGTALEGQRFITVGSLKRPLDISAEGYTVIPAMKEKELVNDVRLKAGKHFFTNKSVGLLSNMRCFFRGFKYNGGSNIQSTQITFVNTGLNVAYLCMWSLCFYFSSNGFVSQCLFKKHDRYDKKPFFLISRWGGGFLSRSKAMKRTNEENWS